MVTTILFDLDGTLLPMDQDAFLKHYFSLMVRHMVPHGYDANTLVQSIWKATEAMVMNDGSVTNAERLWQVFESFFGEGARRDEELFLQYYRTAFQDVQNTCGFDLRAKEAIRAVKNMGFRVALATNPLFPAVATHSRIRWAGLQAEDFELVTTYENSRSCKPNPQYYRDVIQAMGVTAEECVMVGNDVTEDMVAESLGMKVFLLTDCLINKSGTDISRYPHGSFPELMTFIGGLNK